MNRMRKILVATLLVGGAATAIGAGTFASFTASTSNAGNTFDTGTLVLSNVVDAGSACLSTGGGNTDVNSNSCDIAFTKTVRKPGDGPYSANITIKNEGSLAGGQLKLYRSAACATIDDVDENFHGTGNVCDAVRLTIEETDSSFAPLGSPVCVYGGASCAFNNAKDLLDFSTTYTSFASGLNAGTLAAGATRYYKISIDFPNGAFGADNLYQGRHSTFGFTWQIEQA
jgi:hypothetical protein